MKDVTTTREYRAMEYEQQRAENYKRRLGGLRDSVKQEHAQQQQDAARLLRLFNQL